MVIYICLVLGWKFWNRTEYVRSSKADIWTGKAEVDRHEAEFLEFQAAKEEQNTAKQHWLRRHALGWIV